MWFYPPLSRPGALPHRTDSSSSSTSFTATSSSPEHHHHNQHMEQQQHRHSMFPATDKDKDKERDRGNEEKEQETGAHDSQSSDLFATPRVTVPEPAALSQTSQARGQGQGQGTQEEREYQWTGSSINSLQYLGVDVLTPAGLPQCTPLVETSTLPTQTHSQQQGQYHNHYNPNMSHSSSFYQSVDHENMLFLHSMLTDPFPFTDLAQDDLFLGDANVLSGGASVGGGTGGGGVSGGGGGGDGSQDHDEVIAKWLASARSPQPSVPSVAAAAAAGDPPTARSTATACR